MRLFAAIALPDEIAASLQLLQAGVPGARWATRDQLHLTLRFVGETDGSDGIVADALQSVSASSFRLVLRGVGQFGGKNPNTLWAGVEASEPLMHLQRKIESALQRAGLPAETRKYSPHVTLARLRHTPRGRLMEFLAQNALFASAPFEVPGFVLYSSLLASGGSLYRAERAYPLR